MKIQYYDSQFDIPDILIEKFAKDFECLPGSGQYESIKQLRESVYDILDAVAIEPDLVEEREYMSDFIRALAIKQALARHGILYDA
jgi:hypothetical protein